MKEYEKCQVDIVNEYISGYNWDRPVAFIDNNTFVLACDNTNFNDEDFIYNQLRFYNIDDIKIDESDNNEYKYLESYKSINANLFGVDENNEVHGKLYYYKNNLIALDSKNNNIYNLNNEVLKNICTMPNNKFYFSDKVGIIYYIDNDIIKEINIEHHL